MNIPSYVDSSIWLSRVSFKLRFYREASRMSQREASHKLNIGFRSYQRIESGEALCDIFFLYRFCVLFKVDMNSLTINSAPEPKPGLKMIFSDDELKSFEFHPTVQNSKILDRIKMIESLESTNRKALEGQDFLTSKFCLSISTPNKFNFNLSSHAFLNTLVDHSFKKITLDEINERLNHWDILFYYRPKYSVRSHLIMDKEGNQSELFELTVHHYQAMSMVCVSTFEHSLGAI